MPKLIDIELEKIVIVEGVRKTFDEEAIASHRAGRPRKARSIRYWTS